MDIICRKAAIKQNLDFYFTGKPCSRGRSDRRRTSNGVCQCELCLSNNRNNEALRSKYSTDEAYRERKKLIAKQSRDRNKNRAREWSRNYRTNHRDSINQAARDWYNAKSDEDRKVYSSSKYYKSLVNSMYNNAKSRAKRLCIPFSISKEDIIIPEVCPVLGIELIWGVGNGRMNDSSPSLDRRDPSLGYVPGNVTVISWRANRLKGDAVVAELQLVCVYMMLNP